MVPFTDLTQVPHEMRDLWFSATKRVINSGKYVGGNEVEEFESEFGHYLGTPYVVGVGNGLDALVLALQSLNIGTGARVAVPAHTFIATWLAVLEVGASPIAVDIDELGQIDLEDLSRIPNLDAVIPVHMHGGHADLDKLCNWALLHDIKVIEDCAQAHGSVADNRKLGTWGDAGCFSFYPTKNLGAIGDAGAIAVKDPVIYERLLELRNYGASVEDKYLHARIGKNSRLDPIQAAVLRESLQFLDYWNERRRSVAEIYLSAFDSHDNEDITPLVSDITSSVFHHFVIRAEDREATIASLQRARIGFEIHYPRTAASEIELLTGVNNRDHQMATRLSQGCISLPMNQWISDGQVGLVADWLSSAKART